MKINNTSANFSGNLILKKQDLWTDAMIYAIKNNPSIQKKLSGHNIIGHISSKVERRTPAHYSFHRKGDKIYRVNFVVKKEKPSFLDRIKNLFGQNNEVHVINGGFHSESTTVSRIEDLEMK